MKIPRKVFGDLIEVIFMGAIKATKYLGENQVIKATRRMYKYGGNKEIESILITMGSPNYSEREFIKLYKKAKGTFPMKKIQIKWGSEK